MTERKFYTGEAKVLNAAEGQVEAYVNTMGVRDHDGDIIDPEAFNASIKNNLPIPVLSGHDQKQIVGKVLYARTDEVEGTPAHRLHAVMQMNMETQIGREAFSNIAGNYVREWSVGFNIPGPDAVTYDKAGKDSTRRILNLDWVEVSSVIRGASPATMTIAAKSESNPDEIEEVGDVITEIIEITETSETSPDDTEETAAATDEQSAADALTRIALLRTRLRLKEKLTA